MNNELESLVGKSVCVCKLNKSRKNAKKSPSISFIGTLSKVSDFYKVYTETGGINFWIFNVDNIENNYIFLK